MSSKRPRIDGATEDRLTKTEREDLEAEWRFSIDNKVRTQDDKDREIARLNEELDKMAHDYHELKEEIGELHIEAEQADLEAFKIEMKLEEALEKANDENEKLRAKLRDADNEFHER